MAGVDTAKTPFGHRARILIIDAEEAMRDILRESLVDEHDVVDTASPKEALSPIERGDGFDLILCDLMMPDLTGIDIYERILQIRPEAAARMVFMTGGAIGLRSEAFLDAVPNRRLHKPFRRDDLVGVVRQALLGPERK